MTKDTLKPEPEFPCKGRILHKWTAKLAPGEPKFKVHEYGIIWASFHGKALWSASYIKPSKYEHLIDVEIDELRIIPLEKIEIL